MPIRLRFLLVANVFLAGLGVIGFLTVTLVDRASSIFFDSAHQSIDRVQLSDQIRANLPDLRALEMEYIMTANPQDEAVLLAKMDARRKGLRQVMAHYEREGNGSSHLNCGSCHRVFTNIVTTSPQYGTAPTVIAGTQAAGQASTRYDSTAGGAQPPNCVSCHHAFKRYLQSHNQIASLAAQGRRQEAFVAYRNSEGQYSVLLNEAESFRQAQYAAARQESLRGQATGERARNILVAAFICAALLTFLLGHSFSRYIHRRLAVLMEGTRRVMRGNLHQPIQVRGRDEFTELASAFNTMTDSLEATQAENGRLHEAAIRLREERIALLSDGLKRATEAQENERKRVARELHDEVGQALTALQLGLGRLAKTTRSPHVRTTAGSLNELTVETLKGVRNLALDLRPSMLDEIGLAATLHGYTKTVAGRMGIPVELTINGLNIRLPPELEITIFRIVQEALTNTARYAHARHAWVDLTLAGSTLRVVVRDDGAGFDVEATRADYRRSLGLSGMEERCRFSDGVFAVESAPGRGTKVICTWQLAPAPAGVATDKARAPAEERVDATLVRSGGLR